MALSCTATLVERRVARRVVRRVARRLVRRLARRLVRRLARRLVLVELELCSLCVLSALC